MPVAFKLVALRQIRTGKIRDNFDLWRVEELQYEEILRKVKDQAMSKKLDADVSKGKAGVAVGAERPTGDCAQQGVPCFGQPEPGGEGLGAVNANAGNQKWKQKSKGNGNGK